MKKFILVLLSIIITFIVTSIIAINTIKVENIENGMVTLELFGQHINYYYEK